MNNKLTQIEIQNMRVRAFLGINKIEREKKQDIVISIKFKYDAEKAIAGDEFNEAIDYKKITKRILKFVEASQYFLIETLTDKIYEMVKTIDGVEKVCVATEKPHALRFCDNLIVTRSDYDE